MPDNCYVEQVAYVVRHGSRYPDNGAYQQWVALYEKVGLKSTRRKIILLMEIDPSSTIYCNGRTELSSVLEASPYESYGADCARESNWFQGSL